MSEKTGGRVVGGEKVNRSMNREKENSRTALTSNLYFHVARIYIRILIIASPRCSPRSPDMSRCCRGSCANRARSSRWDRRSNRSREAVDEGKVQRNEIDRDLCTNLIDQMLKAGCLRAVVGVVLDGKVGEGLPWRLVSGDLEALAAQRRFVFDWRRCDQRDSVHVADLPFLLRGIQILAKS